MFVHFQQRLTSQIRWMISNEYTRLSVLMANSTRKRGRLFRAAIFILTNPIKLTFYSFADSGGLLKDNGYLKTICRQRDMCSYNYKSTNIKTMFDSTYSCCLDRLDISWWRHEMETFPHYWPFVRRIHRSPVNSPHKGQWRGTLMFSVFCVWINGWVNNRETGDLRRYRAHYDVIVM